MLGLSGAGGARRADRGGARAAGGSECGIARAGEVRLLRQREQPMRSEVKTEKGPWICQHVGHWGQTLSYNRQNEEKKQPSNPREGESEPMEKQEKGGDSVVQGGILKRRDREHACTPPSDQVDWGRLLVRGAPRQVQKKGREEARRAGKLPRRQGAGGSFAVSSPPSRAQLSTESEPPRCGLGGSLRSERRGDIDFLGSGEAQASMHAVRVWGLSSQA